MASATAKCELPYAAQRILRAYEPAFRARLTHYLKKRGPSDGRTLSWEDIQSAVSQTFTDLTTPPKPSFDPSIERQAIDDYNASLYCTTEEWINELRGSLAESDSE